MSMEAKASLLSGLEFKLSSVLTVVDMSKVLEIVSDQLSTYDVDQQDVCDGTPDDLLDTYITALQIEGKSEKTIERYSYLIKRMMRTVRVPTRQVTVYHLRRYLADEKARGISDRTLEGTREVFSAYFNWLQREGLISSNPTTNLGVIKYSKKVRAAYSEVDIERLKCQCETARDKAIVCFLLSTGCRISEMTQLNRDSVDLVSLECTVMGKGNKERTVYLDPVAGMALKDYLDSRDDDYEALFIGRGTQRLHPGGVRKMLKGLEENTSVEHVHPHKFRRTLATNLIRHGMPIQEVAAILGHDKLDTTMQYVVMDKTNIKNAYRRYA